MYDTNHMDKFIRHHDPAYHAYMSNENPVMKTGVMDLQQTTPVIGEGTTLQLNSQQETGGFCFQRGI